MVHSLSFERPAPPAEYPPQGRERDDPSVEPVVSRPGGEPWMANLPPRARLERLRRLALEARVVTLEHRLERAERRRERVVEHYEQLLQEREDQARSPVFSWLRR